MSYFLNRFLKDSRRRLNQIIIAIHWIKVTGWVGAAGAVVILAARAFGWTVAALGIWLILIAIGGLVGVVMGWRYRLDMSAAARWVDDYQRNAEAYSAALVCLGRNCSEPLDELVVERAEILAGNPSAIRWPTRYLIRKAAITGGLLLGALVIVLWNPPPAWNLSRYIIPSQTTDSVLDIPRQNIDRLEQQRITRELALQYFPKDVKQTFYRFIWKNRNLPDFRRTAEAALTRNGVPSEYDDFVRAYFLELSREIKGNSPESEDLK